MTISVRSRCDSVFDQTPIFMTRLVDDSGCKMTGGRATVGKLTGRLGDQPLLHELPNSQRVRSLLENQHDLRETEHRLGTHCLDVRQAVESVLDRRP